MKHRILIMGAAGSGKSTLGTALAKALGYRYGDTDDLYWLPSDLPFEQKRDRDEQLELVKGNLARDGGIVLSGSFSDWGDEILPFADAVIWIVAPTEIRLERLRTREHERYGDAISPGGTMHEKHETFLRWAASYDDGFQPGRCFARDLAWFEDLRCPALRIDGVQPLPEQMLRVHSWLDEVRTRAR